MRLQKQELMFNVIESDQDYYRSLIAKTNEQIDDAKAKILTLESQLQHERTLKEYKHQFEHLSAEINNYAPSQTSLAAIGRCETEAAILEAKSRNEEIRRKQDQLHVLVSMIRDFRADEKLDAKEAVLGQKAGATGQEPENMAAVNGEAELPMAAESGDEVMAEEGEIEQ